MGVKRLAQDFAELATEKEPETRVTVPSSLMPASRSVAGFWVLPFSCGTNDEIEPRFGALSVRPGDGEADGGFEHRRYYFLSRKRHEAGTNAFGFQKSKRQLRRKFLTLLIDETSVLMFPLI